MSYSILYKSMFVKTKRGFIPMVQIGDNNVWECDNHRRARNWTNLRLDGEKKFFTHNEIFSCLEEWNNSYKKKLEKDLVSTDEWKRSGGSFGFYEAISISGHHTTGTTFNQVKNLIMYGEKVAVSLEYAIQCIGLYFSYYENGNRQTLHIKSENDFYKLIDGEFKNKKFWIGYNEYSADKFYDLQKAVSGLLSKRMGRKQKYGWGQPRDYIIECVKRGEEGLNWYVKSDGNTFSLTQNIREAHIFNKQKVGKLEVSDIIFDIFGNEINGLHFEYKFQQILDSLSL